ncbi:hypothetical protein TCON_2742, partial [Astathelohania contejeani]
NDNKDRILVITPNPLDLYIYCFDYLYNSNENNDSTITINEDLEEFLDQVLIIYNFCIDNYVNNGNIEILYHRFQTIHIEAYNYTEPSITYDFVMWLKKKCFKGVYKQLNVIILSDMLNCSYTMPPFFKVQLYDNENIDMPYVAAIFTNLSFHILECSFSNFQGFDVIRLFETGNINTSVYKQLATYNEINNSNNTNPECVNCDRNIKGEYLACKLSPINCNMVTLGYTCYNSSKFVCAQCATYDCNYNIFDNIKYLE